MDLWYDHGVDDKCLIRAADEIEKSEREVYQPVVEDIGMDDDELLSAVNNTELRCIFSWVFFQSSLVICLMKALEV